jgi:hypothetical protein
MGSPLKPLIQSPWQLKIHIQKLPKKLPLKIAGRRIVGTPVNAGIPTGGFAATRNA